MHLKETLSYLLFGILAVLINTVTFLSLFTPLGDIAANTIAFFITVQFAYMTNTKFVFKDKFTKKNFLQFWGMRIGTILIDNGGLWLLLTINCDRFLSKCIVNAIVIILNYIFSKFFIYKKRE